MNYGSKEWIIEYAVGGNPKFSRTNTGWKLNIPPAPKIISFVRTVDKVVIGKNKKEIILTATFDLTPNCVIGYKYKGNECDVPASIRPILIRNMYGPYNRWFPSEKITIAPGTFTINIPLNPQHWTSVYGKSGDMNNTTKKFFNMCKQEPINLGIAIGGGCFYGHGINALSGSGNIELVRLSVA